MHEGSLPALCFRALATILQASGSKRCIPDCERWAGWRSSRRTVSIKAEGSPTLLLFSLVSPVSHRPRLSDRSRNDPSAGAVLTPAEPGSLCQLSPGPPRGENGVQGPSVAFDPFNWPSDMLSAACKAPHPLPAVRQLYRELDERRGGAGEAARH